MRCFHNNTFFGVPKCSQCASMQIYIAEIGQGMCCVMYFVFCQLNTQMFFNMSFHLFLLQQGKTTSVGEVRFYCCKAMCKSMGWGDFVSGPPGKSEVL